MTLLVLPESAAPLWTPLRESLDKVFPGGNTGERWSLGGGTILAAFWDNHRCSTDLDALIWRVREKEEGANLTELFKSVEQGVEDGLDRAMHEHGGRRRVDEADGEQRRSYVFPSGKIDLFEPDKPRLWAPTAFDIAGRKTLVETVATILYGKISGRGLYPPVRDVFDVGVAKKMAADALVETAEALGKKKTAAVVEQWRRQRARLAKLAAEDIQGVKPKWKHIQTDPGKYGAQALEDSWTQVVPDINMTIRLETDELARTIREIRREEGYGRVEIRVTPTGCDVGVRGYGDNVLRDVAKGVDVEELAPMQASLEGKPEAEIPEIKRMIERTLAEQRRLMELGISRGI